MLVNKIVEMLDFFQKNSIQSVSIQRKWYFG